MFSSIATIADINHAIQLALTPVFLLTGIAGILNVMTGRLARIIDRGRQVTEGSVQIDPAARAVLRTEIINLDRRRHLTSRAINACTLAALLVCTVIATLFIDGLLAISLRWLVGTLFTAATFALIVGLWSFLGEVRIAMQTVRIPLALLDE
ncbi:MAG: DUF2721 domain-containing protein [Proteobacteria bacterium]|nr:DUF2721 domain-containing protein [Pseudomonadota bacterium]